MSSSRGSYGVGATSTLTAAASLLLKAQSSSAAGAEGDSRVNILEISRPLLEAQQRSAIQTDTSSSPGSLSYMDNDTNFSLEAELNQRRANQLASKQLEMLDAGKMAEGSEQKLQQDDISLMDKIYQYISSAYNSVSLKQVRQLIAQHPLELILICVIIIYLVYYFSRVSRKPRLIGNKRSNYVSNIRSQFDDIISSRFSPLIYFWGTNPQTCLFGYLQGNDSNDEMPRSKFKRQLLYISDVQYLASNIDLNPHYEQKQQERRTNHRLINIKNLELQREQRSMATATNSPIRSIQKDSQYSIITPASTSSSATKLVTTITSPDDHKQRQEFLSENLRLALSNSLRGNNEELQQQQQQQQLQEPHQQHQTNEPIKDRRHSLKHQFSSGSSSSGSDSGVFAACQTSSSASSSSLTIDMSSSSDDLKQQVNNHNNNNEHERETPTSNKICSCASLYSSNNHYTSPDCYTTINSNDVEGAKVSSTTSGNTYESNQREQLEFGQCALDWHLDSHRNYHKNKQVVLISAGMTTGSDKKYVTDTVKTLDELGYEVCVFIRRGVGGLKLSSTRFFSPSKWRDFETAIVSVRRQRPNARLVAVGFSFGSIELCRYLSMSGKSSLVDYALLISCPFDPEAGGRNMRKRALNRKIDAYLAKNLGKQLYQAMGLSNNTNLMETTCRADGLHNSTNGTMTNTTPTSTLSSTIESDKSMNLVGVIECQTNDGLPRHQQQLLSTLQMSNYNGSIIDLSQLPKIKSLVDFEDNYNRIIQNYPDSGAYAADSRLNDQLANIQTPTLCLSSEDDFMAPLKLLPLKQIEQNKNLCMILTKRGGHMAFIDGLVWPKKPYFAQRIITKYIKTIEILAKETHKQNNKPLSSLIIPNHQHIMTTTITTNANKTMTPLRIELSRQLVFDNINIDNYNNNNNCISETTNRNSNCNENVHDAVVNIR